MIFLPRSLSLVAFEHPRESSPEDNLLMLKFPILPLRPWHMLQRIPVGSANPQQPSENRTEAQSSWQCNQFLFLGYLIRRVVIDAQNFPFATRNLRVVNLRMLVCAVSTCRPSR